MDPSSVIMKFGMIRTCCTRARGEESNQIITFEKMELYLSKQEWVVLRYATLAWTCFQSWDLAWELYDRYSKRTSAPNEPGSAEATR